MIAVHVRFGSGRAEPTCAHRYIVPAILGVVRSRYTAAVRIVDVGCGNGYLASELAALGHEVIGVDVSADRIEIAQRTHRAPRFETVSIYDPRRLREVVGGEADVVVATEVIEHLFYPRELFRACDRILRREGVLVVTTPYHGYLKNLAISLVGSWDGHFKVETDGGHIKFFSRRSLAAMALECGFSSIGFQGLGRFPMLWKSMMATMVRS